MVSSSVIHYSSNTGYYYSTLHEKELQTRNIKLLCKNFFTQIAVKRWNILLTFVNDLCLNTFKSKLDVVFVVNIHVPITLITGRPGQKTMSAVY